MTQIVLFAKIACVTSLLYVSIDPVAAPENVLPNQEWISQGQIGFSWQPPPKEDQNGVIILYEYELEIYPVALREEWPKRGTTPDTFIILLDLPDDTLFQFQVRALTSAGAGPYSNFAFAKTPPESTSNAPQTTSSAVTAIINPMVLFGLLLSFNFAVNLQ